MNATEVGSMCGVEVAPCHVRDENVRVEVRGFTIDDNTYREGWERDRRSGDALVMVTDFVVYSPTGLRPK